MGLWHHTRAFPLTNFYRVPGVNQALFCIFFLGAYLPCATIYSAVIFGI